MRVKYVGKVMAQLLKSCLTLEVPVMNGRKAASAAKLGLVCLSHTTMLRHLKASVQGSCVPSKKGEASSFQIWS